MVIACVAGRVALTAGTVPEYGKADLVVRTQDHRTDVQDDRVRGLNATH